MWDYPDLYRYSLQVVYPDLVSFIYLYVDVIGIAMHVS